MTARIKPKISAAPMPPLDVERALVALDCTAAQLARATGVTFQTVQNWRARGAPAPAAALLRVMLAIPEAKEALGVRPARVFFRSPPPDSRDHYLT